MNRLLALLNVALGVLNFGLYVHAFHAISLLAAMLAAAVAFNQLIVELRRGK